MSHRVHDPGRIGRVYRNALHPVRRHVVPAPGARGAVGGPAVAGMKPDDRGTWLFHCHVNDHIGAGMLALCRLDWAHLH